MNKYQKKQLVLRSQLIGANYTYALRAMNHAEKYHTGVRKDGVTPEFDHQVSIALFAMTLPNLMYREEVIATIMLHDTSEDYGLSQSEIRGIFHGDPIIINRITDAVWKMTKKFRGEVKDDEQLFIDMSEDEVASISKGCDRVHNIQTMIGVFGPDKQRQYIGDVEAKFLPMLKRARRNFPEQAMAYENIKHMLISQCELISASLEA